MAVSIIVPGNVGNEVEFFRFGNDGEGMKFDVAVSEPQRDGSTNTRWYKIAVFGRLKDQAKQQHEEGNLVTGAKVLVMGSFQPREYATRTGETRMSFDVTAASVEVLYSPQPKVISPSQADEYYGNDDDELPNF